MARPRLIVGRKRREREEPLATGRGPERVLGFLKRHTTLKLLPWQVEVIEGLFREQDGRRAARTAFVSVGRGNGKSTLGAAVATYLLFADGPKAHVLVVAGDTAQAQDIVFKAAADLVRASPALERLAVIQRREILVPSLGARLQVIPADPAGAHGYHPTAVIFDELHTQPTRDLWDTLSTAMPGLLLALTTAGFDRESIAFEKYAYAKAWLSGAIVDSSFYAYIAEAPADADWTLPETWRLANPALGATLEERYFEEEVRRALESPASQNAFRRLHLNQWTQTVTRWIDAAVWDENGATRVDEAALQGRSCYGGLDLSSVSDLTALVWAFPSPTDPDALDIVCRFWCPEARLHDPSNKYRHQYQAWKQQGYLRTTPGDAVDYAFIREAILEDARRFKVIEVAFDPWRAYDLASKLLEERVQMVEMRQGFKSFAAPMLEFERRLRARKIHHGGNPVLRWMADNVTVKTDEAGNLKPDRADAQGKIDGAVALVMALDRAMRHGGAASVYERRGVLSVQGF